uniref:Uncharacterized protein n=1 Tax=Rhizophora mucronata TaxID=61149 RepID=A0A2P2J2I5_RHIMU
MGLVISSITGTNRKGIRVDTSADQLLLRTFVSPPIAITQVTASSYMYLISLLNNLRIFFIHIFQCLLGNPIVCSL